MSFIAAHAPADTGGAPDLAHIELGITLAPGLEAVALVMDDPEAMLQALADFQPDGLPRGALRKRRAEFLAGRYAAQSALGRLGQSKRVGRNVDGTPAWPEGVAGSISHGGGIACAVVGRRPPYGSIGVDIERIVEDAGSDELARAIASTDELLLLGTALGWARRGARLSILFSCKESLFKCLFPLTREFMEFEDARLVGVGRASPAGGALTLRLERSLSPEFSAGKSFEAEFFVGGDHVESVVTVRS